MITHLFVSIRAYGEMGDTLSNICLHSYATHSLKTRIYGGAAHGQRQCWSGHGAVPLALTALFTKTILACMSK